MNWSINNPMLKQIGLGFLNHESAHGHIFPAGATRFELTSR